jgi:outer membrane receptor protein involved in Fe transport
MAHSARLPCFSSATSAARALAGPGSGTRVGAVNSASIPGYSRIDLTTRYEARYGETKVVWRAGIDNLLDTRAWRESPYQFSHAHLSPLAPRTLRASMQFGPLDRIAAGCR